MTIRGSPFALTSTFEGSDSEAITRCLGKKAIY